MSRVCVEVRDEFCVGSGNCASVAPGLFAVEDGGPARVLRDELTHEDLPLLEEAESMCPTDAIVVTIPNHD